MGDVDIIVIPSAFTATTGKAHWEPLIRARAIESQSEIFAADQLPLAPWTPTLQYVYVRIQPTEVPGRRLPRGPEPARY